MLKSHLNEIIVRLIIWVSNFITIGRRDLKKRKYITYKNVLAGRFYNNVLICFLSHRVTAVAQFAVKLSLMHNYRGVLQASLLGPLEHYVY